MTGETRCAVGEDRGVRALTKIDREDEIAPDLASPLSMIDKHYPRLRIDFLSVKGTFGPEIIELLSRRLNVPKNYMFIGTPGDRSPHRIEDLGGVRVIL